MSEEIDRLQRRGEYQSLCARNHTREVWECASTSLNGHPTLVHDTSVKEQQLLCLVVL
jgi:hypothetical protein